MQSRSPARDKGFPREIYLARVFIFIRKSRSRVPICVCVCAYIYKCVCIYTDIHKESPRRGVERGEARLSSNINSSERLSRLVNLSAHASARDAVRRVARESRSTLSSLSLFLYSALERRETFSARVAILSAFPAGV